MTTATQEVDATTWPETQEPVALEYLLDEIRAITPRAKEFKEHVAELQAGFNRQFTWPIEQARNLAAQVEELRKAAKGEMLRRLLGGDDITFPPGVYLRRDVEIDAAESEAKAYCLLNCPDALTLNIPRFKAHAKTKAEAGDPLPFVTLRTKWTPCIAEDLDAAANKPAKLTEADLLPGGLR